MDASRQGELAPMTNITMVERKSDREVVVDANVRRSRALGVRGVVDARAVHALVGAEVDGDDAAFLRDGCTHRWRIPPRVRRWHGLLRQVPRGDPAIAHRVDERRGRRERLRHHGHPDGSRWQDAGRHRASAFPPRKRSTLTGAARRMRCTRHSSNWMICSSTSRRSRDRCSSRRGKTLRSIIGSVAAINVRSPVTAVRHRTSSATSLTATAPDRPIGIQ